MNNKNSLSIILIGLLILCWMPAISSTSPKLLDNISDTILFEGFENGFPPENWTNDGWLLDYNGEPYHGDHWAFCKYNADELITPPLEFDYNTTLSFFYRAECASCGPPDLEVWLDDYDTGTMVWSDYNINIEEYEQVTINLSMYMGVHTIHFVGLIPSQYGVMIDDVMVTTGEANHILDIDQSIFDRGFPIRHAADGDWAAAQNFTPTMNVFNDARIYLRKFGNPEFNLTIELREDHIQGTLHETLTFTPEELSSSWQWLNLDFSEIIVEPDMNLFIVCPPAPSGVTTSFGYEWGYAFGDQYQPGAFWFTRDGGTLWRDLPTSYEFVFKTYGYS